MLHAITGVVSGLTIIAVCNSRRLPLYSWQAVAMTAACVACYLAGGLHA